MPALARPQPIAAPPLPDDETALRARHAAMQPYAELHGLWVKASPQRRQTTLDDYWQVLQSFADRVGRKPLGALGRKDVMAFRDHLLERGLSATTAAHRVGILKTLFNVGIGHELLAVNPAAQVRAPKRAGKSRVAFAADDLRRIFHSEIYRGDYRPQAGGREACYWLPLLALFTGARVEELAQLLVEDVRHAAGLGHYLNISDEAAHAQLKNAASRRRVPVHPILIACGFIDHVQQTPPGSLLFPHLKPNPRGKLGGYFSNFFSIYLRRRVRITDKRKVFHSFRHTFKDICRKVGIEEAVHDALTGHTGNAVSRRYGNEQYPLEPLFVAMEKYDIAELDLAHLYRRPVAKPLLAGDIKLISAYHGVTVAFTAARAKREMKPFVVALCDGAEAGFDVASNRRLFGELPGNKQLLVNAWIEIHREELLASWQAGQLTGNWGTFVGGRAQTMGWDFTAVAMPVVGGSGFDGYDAAKKWGLINSSSRANNAVAYISPTFGGLSVAYNHSRITENVADTAAGTTDKDSTANLLGLNYANGPLTAGLIYAKQSLDHTTASDDATEWALRAGYDFGVASVGFAWQNLDADNAATGKKDSKWGIGVGIPVGPGSFFANYGKASVKSTAASDDAKDFAFGYLYGMSKRTDIYAGYIKHNSDVADTDKRTVAVGLRHKF